MWNATVTTYLSSNTHQTVESGNILKPSYHTNFPFVTETTALTGTWISEKVCVL